MAYKRLLVMTKLLRTYAGVDKLKQAIEVIDGKVSYMSIGDFVEVYKGTCGSDICSVLGIEYRYDDVVYVLLEGPLHKQQIAVRGNPYAIDWWNHLHTARVRDVNNKKPSEIIPKSMTYKTMVREWFEYCNGCLYWRESRGGNAKGKRAGAYNDRNYRVIRVHGEAYKEHVLIWIYHNGAVELGKTIDHVDRNSMNNAIENLAEVTNEQNQDNKARTARNTTGYKGVTKGTKLGRYRSDIKGVYLGTFDSIEEASKAYDEAHKELESYVCVPDLFKG